MWLRSSATALSVYPTCAGNLWHVSIVMHNGHVDSIFSTNTQMEEDAGVGVELERVVGQPLQPTQVTQMEEDAGGDEELQKSAMLTF